MSAPRWTFTPEPVGSPVARALWRDYYTEVGDRWHRLHEGRSTPPDDLARGIAAERGTHLDPPSGALLIARYDGRPAGTAGVHLIEPGVAEMQRVYLAPDVRGRGGAALLVAAAEDAARELGAARLVLDTRSDLVEARALYARLGYAETAPYNDHRYAEHWFAKHLTDRDR
ncbi:GNAT superfamily N-acetyltransferase [Nocardia transvalensis]|uniref:GNAT superfamily N-acetyltransferase n=1 Tax=Nocardia transvalensis TaxID=37333 RepID=A0A7W9PC89_9NOCA|nr:GNAT family N-acetyltransferase [Nocardia transvalensis]MBB5913492.1 GNAT superfamily N-acetyltransferase [Nocardia transvalensis]